MVEIRIPDATVARSARRMPRADAAAAVGAGLYAGTLMMVLLLALSVSVYDESPWKLLRMMAAVTQGTGALSASSFDLASVAAGFALHVGLSALYALALASVIAALPRGAAPWLGLAFGAALYAANLHGFTALFPWFAELRGFDTLAAHMLFGLLAAQSYTDRA